MSELEQFVGKLEQFCAQHGFKTSRWKGGAKSTPNLVEVITSSKVVLYIKESNIGEGFWGVNENQMQALDDSATEWNLVLLRGPSQSSYLLSGAQVIAATTGAKWSHSKQDYKVHEGDELSEALEFSDHLALLESLFEVST